MKQEVREYSDYMERFENHVGVVLEDMYSTYDGVFKEDLQ